MTANETYAQNWAPVGENIKSECAEQVDPSNPLPISAKSASNSGIKVSLMYFRVLCGCYLFEIYFLLSFSWTFSFNLGFNSNVASTIVALRYQVIQANSFTHLNLLVISLSIVVPWQYLPLTHPDLSPRIVI